MKLYIEDFEAGLKAVLSKMAEGDVFDLGGSAIFPRIDQQTKWNFARAHNNLRLSDGTNVYNFSLPDGEKDDEDFPVMREDDMQHTDFHNGVESHGTAQIHRADPGSIYFTLQDGRNNPTYTLRHTGGKTWKAIPKNKDHKIAFINETDFLKGAEDVVKRAGFGDMLWNAGDHAVKGMANGANGALNAIMSPSKIQDMKTSLGTIPSYAVAGGIGLGAGAVYDQAKRHFYNTPEENEQETGQERLLGRYMLPSLGMMGAHSLENTLWPQYSNLRPAFDR